MNEKEKLLRKIELKDSSGMDISGELAEVSAMAIKEMKFDEFKGERLHLVKERLDNDLKNLPATTSALGLIKVKLDNIKKVYDEFYKAYMDGRYDKWELEIDYLSVLGSNILWDTESLCDTENPSFDVEKTRGHLLDHEHASIKEYVSLFPDYLNEAYKSLSIGGEKTYLEIGNLTLLLTFYGLDAIENYKKDAKIE